MGKKKSSSTKKETKIDVKKLFAPFLRKQAKSEEKPDGKEIKKALKQVRYTTRWCGGGR